MHWPRLPGRLALKRSWSVGVACILANLLPSKINCELSARAGASLIHPGRSKPQHHAPCHINYSPTLLNDLSLPFHHLQLPFLLPYFLLISTRPSSSLTTLVPFYFSFLPSYFFPPVSPSTPTPPSPPPYPPISSLPSSLPSYLFPPLLLIRRCSTGWSS